MWPDVHLFWPLFDSCHRCQPGDCMGRRTRRVLFVVNFEKSEHVDSIVRVVALLHVESDMAHEKSTIRPCVWVRAGN